MKELQTIFQNRWLLPVWIVLAVALIMSWTAAEASEEGPGAWIASAALVVLVLTIHQRSRFDGETLRITFWPVWRRTVRVADIVEVEAVAYRPLRDFTGWGIRGGISPRFRGVVCYTTKGREGVLVRVHEGRDLLLGSARARDWVLAFEAAGVAVVQEPRTSLNA